MSAGRPTVLVVDDTPQNLNVASRFLREHYQTLVALDAEQALHIVQRADPRPDLILLDVMMPGMDGYAACRQLKSDPGTADIPVIFLTALDAGEDEACGFEAGGVDYITKPLNPLTLLARVQTHLRLYAHERHLDQLVHARTQELQRTRLEVIQRLGRAAEFKDDNTGLHVIRMSHYTRLLAQASGLLQEHSDLLFNAAPMHDVGKIGIPDHILQKPGKLTPEEWAIMRTHPAIGAGIIGRDDSELLNCARIVALTHHEKWDGSGYPRGRKGEDIPIEGRIVAVADVFDALTSLRPYKKAWPIEEALAYIHQQSGQHFEPRLVQIFLALEAPVRAIRAKYGDTDEAAMRVSAGLGGADSVLA